MKLPCKTRRNGFTLIELLVVIVIIAALAALSFAVLPRMMRKAKATESMQNLRQFAPLITTYATDHSMMLPAAKAKVKLPGQTTEEELQWTEVCLALLYPDTDLDKFKDKSWWEKNKPFFRNPLYKAWKPLTPGYALNEMIAENVENAKEGAAAADLLAVTVPLAAISEPGRTPLIAPGADFTYRYDTQGAINAFSKGNLKDLVVENKFNVLFVDGHVESMTPKEYVTRKLFELPLASEN